MAPAMKELQISLTKESLQELFPEKEGTFLLEIDKASLELKASRTIPTAEGQDPVRHVNAVLHLIIRTSKPGMTAVESSPKEPIPIKPAIISYSGNIAWIHTPEGVQQYSSESNYSKSRIYQKSWFRLGKIFELLSLYK